MGLYGSITKHVTVRAEEDDDSSAEISITSDDLVDDNDTEAEDESNESQTSSRSDLDSGSGEETYESGNASDAEETDQSSTEDEVQDSLSSVSFGALARAQASLLGKRKRSGNLTSKVDGTGASNEAKNPLEDIRSRIRATREQKLQNLTTKDFTHPYANDTNSGRKGGSDHKEQKKPSRSSKNAPTIQSTKRAVSRKRTVVEIPNTQKSRDPRFDPAVLAHGGSHRNPTGLNKAYGFLDEYRASELRQLKDQLKKTKNVDEKEKMSRHIRSVEDRQRSIDNRKREQEVITEHKKRERQLIREGKKSQPYYLKKSDLRREILVKKYESMGAKERVKALARRRKKVASKEKKELPWARRSLGETTGRDGVTGVHEFS